MYIRPLEIGDHELLSDYYQRNYAFFKPWSPRSSVQYHGVNEWKIRIRECLNKQQAGTAANFILLDDSQESILAHCNLSQIFYGPFKACYMGYGVDECNEGKGLVYQSCLHTINYAFKTLKLHRIMANYMPHNNRSAALLERLGFVVEGLAKDYLEINGRWENHVLTSLTNSNISNF